MVLFVYDDCHICYDLLFLGAGPSYCPSTSLFDIHTCHLEPPAARGASSILGMCCTGPMISLLQYHGSFCGFF